jgi:hypothetical protein
VCPVAAFEGEPGIHAFLCGQPFRGQEKPTGPLVAQEAGTGIGAGRFGGWTKGREGAAESGSLGDEGEIRQPGDGCADADPDTVDDEQQGLREVGDGFEEPPGATAGIDSAVAHLQDIGARTEGPTRSCENKNMDQVIVG